MKISINSEVCVEGPDGVFRGYVHRIRKKPNFQHRYHVEEGLDSFYVDGRLELWDIVITLRTIEKVSEDGSN